MRRLGISAFAASLLIALSGASSAYANHNQVEASLSVLRDGTVLSESSTVVSCSAVTCTVTLAVPNRDFVRLVRATGGNNAFRIDFAAGTSSRSIEIPGTSHWDLLLEVRLLNNSVPTTHDSAVTVTVVITGHG